MNFIITSRIPLHLRKKKIVGFCAKESSIKEGEERERRLKGEGWKEGKDKDEEK